jgi:hypothetical protein
VESGHQQSTAELAEALEAISVDPPFDAGQYRVRIGGPTEAFNAQSVRGVRPQHAVDAAQSPDDVALYAYRDSRLFVTTKLISVSADPFVLLVIGSERGRERSVDCAYRLYGEQLEVEPLAADATVAFQTFLERFGIPYETRGRKVLFVPIITGNIPAGTQPDIESISRILGLDRKPGERPERAFNLHAQFRFSGTGDVIMAWPFLLDIAGYEQELQRHRR